MRELLLDVAGWWLGTAVGGGAILLAGFGAMRLARQPAVRQRVGEWAVLAALAVAVLRLGPSWITVPALRSAEPAALSVPAQPETVSAAPAVEPAGEWVLTADPVVEAVPPAAEVTATFIPAEPAAPAESPWDWRPWVAGLAGLYAAVVAALVARWLLGQWALRRLWRQAQPARGRLRRLFAAMAGRDTPRPGLRLSGRVRVPVAFGLRRPAVVVPAALTGGATDDQLRWVFAHELTHLRRNDPWSYWTLGLAQAVYFYLPWFWWLRRDVRLCQEYIADAAAAGESSPDYAAYLVSLAKLPAAPLGAAGLGSSSDLFRRVNMLLNSSSPVQGHCPRRWSLLAAGALVPAAVLLSGLSLRADPPAADEPNDVVVFKLDEQPAFDVVFRLADEEEDDAKRKDEKKSEEKKAEKKGTIRIEIDLDGANPADIQKQIEAALEKVKKQLGEMKTKEKGEGDAGQVRAELARKMEAVARDKAEAARKAAAEAGRKAAEEGRKAAEEGRKKADEARAMADKIRKEVEEKVKAGKFADADEAKAMAEKIRKEVEEQVKAGKIPGGFAFQGLPGGAGGFGGGMAVAKMSGGRLGVSVEKPSAALADQLDLPKGQGLVIVEVTKGSPAAKAGLKANDILLEIDGKSVSNDVRDLVKALAAVKSDDAVNAVIFRKGKKERVKGIELPAAKSEEGRRGGGEGGAQGGGSGEKKVVTGQLKLGDGHRVFAFDGDGKKIELKPTDDQKTWVFADGKKLEFKQAEGHKVVAFDADGKKIELKPTDDKKTWVFADGTGKIELKPGDEKHVTVFGGGKGGSGERKIIASGGHGKGKGSGSGEKKSADSTVSVEVNDGNLKATMKEGDTTIIVRGAVDGGKVSLKEVTIDEGGSKSGYKSLDDVPEKYRAKVKKLIANGEDSPVRFRFEKE